MHRHLVLTALVGDQRALYVGEHRELTGLWKDHASYFVGSGRPDGRICGLGLGHGARREVSGWVQVASSH